MNIALIGYGKMGKEIEQIAHSEHITVGNIFTSKNNNNASGLTKKSLQKTDVCIDFSTPSTVIDHIEAVAACGKNIVVGTTGWYDNLPHVKRIVASKKIGLLYSANFSVGMNIFMNILSSMLPYIDAIEMYDTAIHEIHHRKKADSPSGTALAFGEIILKQLKSKKKILSETSHTTIKPEQLHITSSRIGNVVGTHTVVFDSEADSIELTHRAKNRSGFAHGALIAARWLKGKQGIYTMNDVISSL